MLDVSGCRTADGTDIQQWSWLNNKCQRFRLVFTDTGDYVRFVNENSGKVADVANCGTADSTDVRQWTWLADDCQKWQRTPAD
ncbi:RICIN domain-containing protein [Streptomyces sp. NPDC059373]